MKAYKISVIWNIYNYWYCPLRKITSGLFFPLLLLLFNRRAASPIRSYAPLRIYKSKYFSSKFCKRFWGKAWTLNLRRICNVAEMSVLLPTDHLPLSLCSASYRSPVTIVMFCMLQITCHYHDVKDHVGVCLFKVNKKKVERLSTLIWWLWIGMSGISISNQWCIRNFIKQLR